MESELARNGGLWNRNWPGMSPTGIGIGADSKKYILDSNLIKLLLIIINLIVINFDCVCFLIKYRRDKPAGRLLMIHMFLLKLDK